MLKQIPGISIVNNKPFLIFKIFSWFSPGDVIPFRLFLKISLLSYCLCCLQYWLFQLFPFSVSFHDTGFPHLFSDSWLSVHLCIVRHSLFLCLFISLYFACSCYHRLPTVRWGQGRHSQEGAWPPLWKYRVLVSGQKPLLPTVQHKWGGWGGRNRPA